MNRAIGWACIGAVILGVAFIALPEARVDKRVGEAPPPMFFGEDGKFDMQAREKADHRPYKSGLRMSIEGRLAWLGF
jgi:hypothetical protein